ncbi:phosphoglycerate dehydrogenase [Inmirania thermothiophila]|uniref:D-3-phosphoglycerate dehydrogenase n=1 Tax=Inmirania thermothiophila TaxID=1750597 RepID=A0A3N1Y172_9GAMM|nr:phosphoglycerate dehydrogenase [Inmirania thermothiophila]ROR32291.1 D-3-phosphoglycerate dehydrogenase [Inmirania thermothiophila]
MYKVLTLNNISVKGLERLPRDRYEVASEIAHPDVILVRSADMHGMEIPPTVKAVARAGAGVNNIPVAELTRRGIPVFNAPGANANAVKELVLAGMLLAARNICQAWHYVRGLEGEEAAMEREVEAGKKRFRGFELPGRTLGVIGLGAIGVQVANTALRLGMKVLGYDPQITVERAWQLSSEVAQAHSPDDLVARSDFVTLHVPLTETTRHKINAERLALMRPGAVLLNFARREIVDEEAVLAALDAGRLHAYVCDFPSPRIKDHPRVVALPHIGASTVEAEENCAVMVAEQVRDWLENGQVRNAVNFPEVQMPRAAGCPRLVVVNANIPNMLGQISTDLAEAGLNIADMINKSRGEIAVTLVDVEGEIPPEVIERIGAIDGVLSVRLIPAAA